MNKGNLKLASYSAMNTVFLLIQENSKSQIVYIDIDSDIVIDDAYEYVYIDLNTDSEGDFLFWKSEFTYPTHAYNYSIYVTELLAWGLEGKQVAMSSITHWNPYSASVSFLPYMFSFENIINSAVVFKDAFGLLAHRSIFTIGPPYGAGGNWYPEAENKYLGFRFPDDDGCMHYGWMRCSVLDSGSVLIIKDYAYETQCDHPILAGSTESYVSITETENTLDASVYSFQKTIYCLINHEDINAELFIYSISGEKIVTQELTAEKTEIDFSKYEVGIYVVEIMSGENKCIKKVWLE